MTRKNKTLIFLMLPLICVISCDKNGIDPNGGGDVPPPQQIIDVSIEKVTSQSGNLYSGDKSVSLLEFKNTGNVRWKFWIGYSLQDKSGTWYDVPADTLTLNPGEVSRQLELAWIIPGNNQVVSGPYTVRVAVWKTDPSLAGAVRLGFFEQKDAFNAFNFLDGFDSFDTNRWIISNKLTPGFGKFNPQNVSVKDGLLSIIFPSQTKDGGEVKTTAPAKYKYGTYRASVKTPSQLPGTYTTFFLYESTNLDEIDIEIWNDGSGKLDLNTWVKGVQKFSAQIILPFDPSSQFHEYRIDYYPNEVSFWVDNVKMRFTNDLSQIPTSLTNIYISGWWPKWMSGNVADTDKFAVYDWILH
jgi:hypothetical protein